MYRLVFNQKIQIWHNGLKSSDASKKSLVATQSAHDLYISWDKIRCFRLSRSKFPEHNILLSAKIKQNCTRAFCFVGLIGCHDSVIYHTFYGPKDLYRLEGHESVMSACQCRSHHAMLQIICSLLCMNKIMRELCKIPIMCLRTFRASSEVRAQQRLSCDCCFKVEVACNGCERCLPPAKI